jgi:capsular exopolysaccharide synthesis family protein
MRGNTAAEGRELRSGLRKIARHKLIVAGSLLTGVCIALIFRDQAIPRYEAEAQVVLGIRSMPIVKFDEATQSMPSQPGVLRTEMDIITSRAMAESVARRMSDEDKELLLTTSAKTSIWTRGVGFITAMIRQVENSVSGVVTKTADQPSTAPASTGNAVDPELAADGVLVDTVLRGVSASNDGQSYTIHIGYSSAQAQLSATLANLYAQAYIESQLDSKAEAAERASAWLSARLVELRGNLEASETAVQNFRHSADIVEDKQGTVTAQQLNEVNSQLVQARAERLDIESRYANLQSILSSGGDIESQPDVMASGVIFNLRDRLAELKRKQSEDENQYTDLYPTDKNVDIDIATLQGQIDSEVKRVIGSLASRLATARGKEAALADELARLKRQFGEGSDAQVQLRLLERESDANRAVYEAYLNRLKETTEQGKMQEPDSYLISSAVPPVRPSYPRTFPLLFLGALFGGLTGVAIAFLRELFEHRLHTVEDVEELTGLRVLALVPALPMARLFRPENHVLRRPRSLFSEALRTTRAAIALCRSGENSKVILVTSSIPGEGKTAFCVSLARSLAADNHKVLLIDADLRRPSVAKAFDSRAGHCLADILDGSIELHQAVRVDARSGAHFVAANDDVLNPQDLLNSSRMALLISEARREYDAIIVDTPPILLVADAALIARWTDHCLFFIRWGSTARDYVAHALHRLDLYKVAVSGVVLSHVNTRRHATFASGEGYYRPYAFSGKRRLLSWRNDARRRARAIAQTGAEAIDGIASLSPPGSPSDGRSIHQASAPIG